MENSTLIAVNYLLEGFAKPSTQADFFAPCTSKSTRSVYQSLLLAQ